MRWHSRHRSVAALAASATLVGSLVVSAAAVAAPLHAPVLRPAVPPSARPSVAPPPGSSSARIPHGSNHNQHYCDGCTPPLAYDGGPVMDTTGEDGVTITPIFWAPEGSRYHFPADYQDIIDGYISDIAADSGSVANVYSVATEYYDADDGGYRSPIRYQLLAGDLIVDTNAYPDDGCGPAKAYTACLTDSQMRDELLRLVNEQGLATDLGHIYPVFLPPKVQTEDLDGTYSGEDFCGYHRAFDTTAGPIVYGNEPFIKDGCGIGQAPNGSLAVDGAIDSLSHELSEALTDPLGDDAAWLDSTGHEIGDICAGHYGPPLGHTDDADPAGTEYNQVINGHTYYTQTEFSDLAYRTLGHNNGCVRNEQLALAATPGQATDVGTVLSYVYPNILDADGSSTAQLQALVTTDAGDAVPGDTVTFSTYLISGSGECGITSDDSAVTDSTGLAEVTYTASSDDVVCGVVSLDALGGQSATGAVYQGTYQDEAVSVEQTFPAEELTVGADPVTFTTVFTNPTDTAIQHARVEFTIFPADDTTADLLDSQVSLAYSTTGVDGPFTPVDLSGSTLTEGQISATIGEEDGGTFPAQSTETITYQVSLGSDAPSDATQPMIDIEVYLDQINPASGSGTNLADTYAQDVTVLPAP